MAGKITLTIDGRPVEAEEGMTIIEAAGRAGIHIPHLCYHPMLESTGACRLCVVEVERARTLQAACVTPAAQGMVVRTDTDRVIAARRMVLDLLFSNHPNDCLTCQRAGDCRLQDYCYEYGVKAGSYRFDRKQVPIDDSNPFFIRDYEKCILCSRCVRICDEVQGAHVIDFVNRGFDTVIGTPYQSSLVDSTCVFCGNCITVCPTAALVPKFALGKGRAWQLQKVRTVCSFCGVGCAIDLLVRDGRVIGANPADGPANHDLLCVKGRFGHDYIHHPDRLTKPLIRKPDAPKGRVGREAFREATWDEALDLVASKLKEVRDTYGSDAVAGLSSAKCTNEENYLFQKVIRAVIGTNNVDHCARL